MSTRTYGASYEVQRSRVCQCHSIDDSLWPYRRADATSRECIVMRARNSSRVLHVDTRAHSRRFTQETRGRNVAATRTLPNARLAWESSASRNNVQRVLFNFIRWDLFLPLLSLSFSILNTFFRFPSVYIRHLNMIKVARRYVLSI